MRTMALGQPTKAFLEVENSSRIECLFNPAELAISKSTNWGNSAPPGVDAPNLQFNGGGSASIALDLTFDTTNNGQDVSTHTSKLLKLLQVDPDLPRGGHNRNSGRPPWVRFHWGVLNSFQAVVQTMGVRFTYFSSSGRPLRAKVTMTLLQWKDEQTLPLQNPTSYTPTLHAIHIVRPGETLDRIAAVRFGDPSQWRLIAEANTIVDPLEVRAGTTLVVPEQPVGSRGE
jgi:nucleoid-associated protein YgaU